VVCAGGTTVRRNPSTFNFIQEAAWVDGGGGYSAIEAKPSYQSAVTNVVGTKRGVPDFSFDADPYTGVYVYDTFPVDGYYFYEWLIVGGTSVSAPALAGIVDRAEGTTGWATSSNGELTYMYGHRTTTADYTDITNGFCGFYMGYSAVGGWDPCTGIGVDVGYAGK
jgi:subtilase family serine protease